MHQKAIADALADPNGNGAPATAANRIHAAVVVSQDRAGRVIRPASCALAADATRNQLSKRCTSAVAAHWLERIRNVWALTPATAISLPVAMIVCMNRLNLTISIDGALAANTTSLLRIWNLVPRK